MWGVKEGGIRNNFQMSAWALGWATALNWGRLGLSKQGVLGGTGEIYHKFCFDYIKLETHTGISSINTK